MCELVDLNKLCSWWLLFRVVYGSGKTGNLFRLYCMSTTFNFFLENTLGPYMYYGFRFTHLNYVLCMMFE